MLSRLRSMSGVPGYIRATCNPDADSWVRILIDWWIGSDGFPIPERSGKIRWFWRADSVLHFADSREELERKFPGAIPKSLTFIMSSIYDNKILMDKDPSYLSNLMALPRVDRMRLLGGNWNVRATAGMYFKREYFEVVRAIPAGWTACIRFWDRASTKPNNETNKDPDWTRGVKLYKYPNGKFLVADLRSDRDTPAKIEDLIKTTASHDGPQVQIMCQQDPGSAGKSEADHFTTMLQGFDVKTQPFFKDKVTRAKPLSAQCEVRNVMVLEAPWNEEFFRELEGFPDTTHDDIVDAFSGAFNALALPGGSLADAL